MSPQMAPRRSPGGGHLARSDTRRLQEELAELLAQVLVADVREFPDRAILSAVPANGSPIGRDDPSVIMPTNEPTSPARLRRRRRQGGTS